MRTLFLCASAAILAACSTSATAPVEPVTVDVPPVLETADPYPDYADMDIAVHNGEFATIQQFTTNQGVSVWLVEEPSIPILSLRMAWEAGETMDPEGVEGLTNAMTYHMNEGAGDLDAQAFFKRMEELNMSFGCGSGNLTTSCNASMLTDNADEAFDMIALAFAEPRFDDGPFERFQREQEVSLKTRETSARYLGNRATREALYPDHPFARDTSAESLAAITQETMRAHKERIMVRDGMLVTAVGAMSAKQLASLIDTAVAGLPETGERIEIENVVTAAPPPDPIVVALPQPQSRVSFTAPAMRQDHPDFYTAYVLNYTFGGGGFESRLMKELRVARGLTYGVGTSVNAGEKYQSWAGSGQTKNESAGEFIVGIKEQMQLVVDEGITPEELADAKAYLKGSYPLRFDSNAKIAGNMMGVRLDDLPVDYFDKRNAKIDAVTLEDVNRVAQEYLSPEKFTFVVVGTPEDL